MYLIQLQTLWGHPLHAATFCVLQFCMGSVFKKHANSEDQ